MARSDLVVVRTFHTQIEADLAKSALDAAGIQSMIRSDTVGGMRPHLAVGGPIRLVVRDEDAQAATEILTTPPKVMWRSE